MSSVPPLLFSHRCGGNAEVQIVIQFCQAAGKENRLLRPLLADEKTEGSSAGEKDGLQSCRRKKDQKGEQQIEKQDSQDPQGELFIIT